MFVGPVFTRELAVAPRRPRLYIYRAVYVASLFVLICTAWLLLAGTQVIRNVGDMARFGAMLFQYLAPLQILLAVFSAAFATAAAVSQEKDRRTLILLMMTRLNNAELVLGKLLASLLPVLVMLLAAIPVFCMVVLFGGVSFAQVARVFAVTLAAVVAAGSLGSSLALWREKTFQTLALTTMLLVSWIAAWEAVCLFGESVTLMDRSLSSWAVGFEPVRAVLAAAQPSVSDTMGADREQAVGMFFLVAAALALALNAWAILRVRVWNPSREIRPRADRDQGPVESIWGAEHDMASSAATAAAVKGAPASSPATTPDESPDAQEQLRADHVDSLLRRNRQTIKTREVWDNPILWREICTWAYGRKIVLIRSFYVLLVAAAAGSLYVTVGAEPALQASAGLLTRIPAAAVVSGLFFLVSLVMVNALAVTSITNERDTLALDLLLATDISPKEFVFGKLCGVFWVTKSMVVAPVLLCVGVWLAGGIGLENLCYVVGALVVLDIFVAMLGIHCGMTYANSRTAIGVSLGTVFFLFLGVVTCILTIISFSGSFQGQLAPFLAFILGGGVGLYVSLGSRNPSTAIGVASLVLPFATFYAITSFVLEYTLSVFLVTAAAYGFTTAALMIPAVYEFDVEMGRTSAPEEAGG